MLTALTRHAKIRLIVVAVVLVTLFVTAWSYIVSRSPLYGPSPDEILLKDFKWFQLAIDCYFGKHDGNFPPYLLGGDREGWEYYNANRQPGEPYLFDPLIEEGFLDSYPENPYFKLKKWGYDEDKAAFSEFLGKVKGPDGKSFDPRFGLKGNKIGNALIEPIILVKPTDDAPREYPRICPGQFYYKPYGEVCIWKSQVVDGELQYIPSWADIFPEIQPFSWEQEQIHTPDDVDFDHYWRCVLGLFGSVTNPGEDTIRWLDMSGNVPEYFPYISPVDTYRNPAGAETEVFLRLPEVTGGGDASTPPFWLPLCFGEGGRTAPDGVPDGVVFTYYGTCDRSGETTLLLKP